MKDLAAAKHRLAATSSDLTKAREELTGTKAILRAVTETTGQSIAQLTTALVGACVVKSENHV